MTSTWPDDSYLLLIYKDKMGDSSLLGSPLLTISRSIGWHLLSAYPDRAPQEFDLSSTEMSDGASATLPIEPQGELFPSKVGIEPDPLPDGRCVWGWWRKPWEFHFNLLTKLQQACARGARPKVLLYNQYLRRLYSAELHGVYFRRHMSTVPLPQAWFPRCPFYYRNTPRLCGAFFDLKIDVTIEADPEGSIKRIRPIELDASFMNSLYVDSSSFELFGSGAEMADLVIPQPEEIVEACARLVDNEPRRSGLRTCEHTVLVLRKSKQKEKTRQVLADTQIAKVTGIEDAVRETAWQDLLEVLRSALPSAWALLTNHLGVLSEIGRKIAAENHTPITRFDFELVSRVCQSDWMAKLVRSREHPDEFSKLGKSLVEWVTSRTEREARESAAKVFAEAWTTAAQRYGLGNLPKTYFDQLPEMEAIACAVKFGIGGKFYRDHLSHNVRAALLGAVMIEQVAIDIPEGINPCAITFFSGLYHDLAMPVTTFPGTVKRLADALSNAELCIRNFHAQSLLDQDVLQRSLVYVAMLGSVKNLLHSLSRKRLKPWSDFNTFIDLTDQRLIFEELLCARTEEHAPIGAALLFQRAVENIREKTSKSYDTSVNDLMNRISGPGTKGVDLEFPAILQCMALHDRKAVIEQYGLNAPPHDTPSALNWKEFLFPTVVSIADEFQEWGRTIGDMEQIAVRDGSVSLEGRTVKVRLELSDNVNIYTPVPFSILESMFGKVRTVGRFMYSDNKVMTLDIAFEKLGAFRVSHLRGRLSNIRFSSSFDYIEPSTWPSAPTQKTSDVSVYDKPLLRIDAGPQRGRDFIVLEPDCIKGDMLGSIESIGMLQGIRLVGERFFLLFNGSSLECEFRSYRFGEMVREHRADEFPEGKIALLSLRPVAVRIEPSHAHGRQRIDLTPHPHFLDYDWRFTENTCSRLVQFAREHIAQTGGPVCYLGCPTVALRHHRVEMASGSQGGWKLFDHGHPGLEKWVDTSEIPRDAWQAYDVFDEPADEWLENYKVVITDPPWYEEHYIAFALRARQLVGPGGIIGITYYPEFDRLKAEVFEKRIWNGIMRDCQPIGSMEIDYSVPAFEEFPGFHFQHRHPTLGIYRAGYMDFYRVPTRTFEIGRPPIRKPADFFPNKVDLGEGHHVRLVTKERLEPLLQGGIWVRFKSKKIIRITEKRLKAEWLAISTRNTLAVIVKESEADGAHPVRTEDELVSAFKQVESELLKAGARLPLEPERGEDE